MSEESVLVLDCFNKLQLTIMKNQRKRPLCLIPSGIQYGPLECICIRLISDFSLQHLVGTLFDQSRSRNNSEELIISKSDLLPGIFENKDSINIKVDLITPRVELMSESVDCKRETENIHSMTP